MVNVEGREEEGGGRGEAVEDGVGLVAQGNHKERTKRKGEMGPVLLYGRGVRIVSQEVGVFLLCGYVPKSISIPV